MLTKEALLDGWQKRADARAGGVADWRDQIIYRPLYAEQRQFVFSPAKRKVVRGGRRGGKTVGLAQKAVMALAEGRRILYAVPTQDQTDAFWYEIKRALAEPLDAGILYKNESRKIIEIPGTQNRIRAKTAWDADTLRGDYADLLLLDEWQLMNEDAWGRVGAPMLIDNNGDVVFIYTPPSIHSRSRTKARDPRHASKLFKRGEADTSGRWETFHFSSHKNPFISKEALEELTSDMTTLAYQQEIEAIDKDEVPGALWKQDIIDEYRVDEYPDLHRLVIAVDPAASAHEGSDETGIIAAGVAKVDGKDHGFVLADATLRGSPAEWAQAAVNAHDQYRADKIVAEKNNGGDMVKFTIETVDEHVTIELVHASRGKQTRAQPVAALYEQGRIHHVGEFPDLEDQQCSWVPGNDSPDRMDALVWAMTDLMLEDMGYMEFGEAPAGFADHRG